MKASFKRTAIAAAVAALCASPGAFAQEEGESTFEQDIFIDLQNRADVHIIKKSKVRKNVEFAGEVEITGTIDVQAAALSIVDNKQISTDNEVFNDLVDNVANVQTVNPDSGNVGINVAGGDINQQKNAVALSVTTVTDGSADAEVFNLQLGTGNAFEQIEITNNATIDDVANTGFAGVFNLNVVAGNGNLQKNDAAFSVATGRLAEANVWVKQEQVELSTTNTGKPASTREVPDPFGQDPATLETIAAVPVLNNAQLTNSLTGAAGDIGVNLAAGTHNYQVNSLALSSN